MKSQRILTYEKDQGYGGPDYPSLQITIPAPKPGSQESLTTTPFLLCDAFQILFILGNACGLVQRGQCYLQSVKDWEKVSTPVVLPNEIVTK